jgi:hypothetical protein
MSCYLTQTTFIRLNRNKILILSIPICWLQARVFPLNCLAGQIMMTTCTRMDIKELKQYSVVTALSSIFAAQVNKTTTVVNCVMIVYVLKHLQQSGGLGGTMCRQDGAYLPMSKGFSKKLKTPSWSNPLTNSGHRADIVRTALRSPWRRCWRGVWCAGWCSAVPSAAAT